MIERRLFLIYRTKHYVAVLYAKIKFQFETYLYVMKANTRATRDRLLPRTISRDKTPSSVRLVSMAVLLELKNPCSRAVYKESMINLINKKIVKALLR